MRYEEIATGQGSTAGDEIDERQDPRAAQSERSVMRDDAYCQQPVADCHRDEQPTILPGYHRSKPQTQNGMTGQGYKPAKSPNYAQTDKDGGAIGIPGFHPFS